MPPRIPSKTPLPDAETLALRALPVAGKGRKGPRELLLMFLHSWYMRIVTHPAFTIPMFIASLYGLYFTPLFDFLMGSTPGHIVMMTHFLLVGLFFFWPIMGVDPGPHRPGYLMRMLELFAGMPFHAFFGIALMVLMVFRPQGLIPVRQKLLTYGRELYVAARRRQQHEEHAEVTK